MTKVELQVFNGKQVHLTNNRNTPYEGLLWVTSRKRGKKQVVGCFLTGLAVLSKEMPNFCVTPKGGARRFFALNRIKTVTEISERRI